MEVSIIYNMSTKQAVISLVTITIIFLLSLYFVAFAGITRPEDPAYNFLYTQNEYGYEKNFAVEDEKIIEQDGFCISDQFRSCKAGTPDLYIFEVENQKSKKVDFEDFQNISILDSKEAPDGYNYEEFAGGFFFGAGDNNILQKNGYNVPTDLDYNDRFLGWVIEK